MAKVSTYAQLLIARDEDVLPFDQRYALENLYYRGQLDRLREEMGEA